ncbi:uncharacterized protein LOC126748655 [Anthonomus grandis grandis]|uniref:uncharacterized protein LOC126748655 n=1 Tax=Anthonomus grandis grandis TaxID=2921223 RepID=UPI002165E9F1|nr:uncharacterized protein LOC126748655 [Anthonomus grandis grandis]
MDGDSKVLYAFRGWIGFVAFMDLGITAKSYIERRSFLTKDLINYNDEEYTTSRIIGLFALLKALVLIYSTLFIHNKPVVDLGKWSLAVTIMLYLSETVYFHSSSLNPTVVFPCVLNIVTLIALFYLPNKLDIWGLRLGSEEENAQLLKQAGSMRRRKPARKN